MGAQLKSRLGEQGALARRNVMIQDVEISLLGFCLGEKVQILPLLIGGRILLEIPAACVRPGCKVML